MRGDGDPWTAVLGRAADLRYAPPAAGPLVHLGQGIVLVELGDEAWRCIGQRLADDPEVRANLADFMRTILDCAGLYPRPAGPVASIESEPDRETAFVYRAGDILGVYDTDRGPSADRPVNLALRHLGVDRTGAVDECAAIGLEVPR